MLKKENRTTTARVKDVLAKGISLHTGALSLKFIASPGSTRFSVVVPNSVYKHAVDRNKLKRQIRDVVEKHVLPKKIPVTALLFAKKPAIELSFKELEQEIIVLTQKIKYS